MTSAREPNEAMTADVFISWSLQQTQGRFELLDGIIYAMSPEQAGHARVKMQVLEQLAASIENKRLSCEAFIDGMAVRVDEGNVFEPDATIVCGARLPGETVLIEAPIIVVEVGSPTAQPIDATVKLARYFRNAHIMHYLVMIPTARSVVHHCRTADGGITTTSHDTGSIFLDPPGIELAVEDIWPASF